MRSLLVYCAGAFGREVMDVARRVNEQEPRWRELIFVDDYCNEPERYGFKVLTSAKVVNMFDAHEVEITIASGEPKFRKSLRERVTMAGFGLGTVIDNSCIISKSAVIEEGVIVTPMCSVSCNSKLSKNSSVNTQTIIGHDVSVGENTVVSSMVNLGGGVCIGENSYVGMGALIKEGTVIGNNTIIGMGSVVFNDIPDGVIALGNPARPIRPNDKMIVFK
jgi:sugar O-acyltransferase (sialic acid O-acetyltransferase NeuD family)